MSVLDDYPHQRQTGGPPMDGLRVDMQAYTEMVARITGMPDRCIQDIPHRRQGIPYLEGETRQPPSAAQLLARMDDNHEVLEGAYGISESVRPDVDTDELPIDMLGILGGIVDKG